MRITTKFSYEDLQHFPNDGNRYEIVDGELFVTPSPIPLAVPEGFFNYRQGTLGDLKPG